MPLVLRTVALTMLLVIGAAPRSGAAEWAERLFETKTHDFGRVPYGAKAEYAFVLTNTNPFAVEIASTRVSCECTHPEVSKTLLNPGEQGTITASLNTHRYNGRKGATITVTFSRPGYAEVQLHVTSYIDKQVEITPSSVELGEIAQGTSVEKEVTVANSGNPQWRIVAVRSTNHHLTGEVVGSQAAARGVAYRLRVRLDGSAPGGYLRDQLVLATNDAHTSQVPVLVEGRVLSDVSVSPGSLFMGVTSPGKKLNKVFVVRGSRPLRILSITCDAPGYAFAPDGADQAKPLHLVPVTFTAGTAPGKVSGTIRIRTDLGPLPCELSVRAVVGG